MEKKAYLTSLENKTVHEDTVLLYDTTYSRYDELYRDEQYEKYEYVIFNKRILPGSLILDLGCGTGLFYEFLKNENINVEKYICIDPSSGMLSRVLSKTHGGDKFRILIIQGYGEQIPLRSNMVDTIYSFTVINNVIDKKSFLYEAKRVLKKHGALLVSFLEKDPNKNGIIEMIDNVCSESPDLECVFIGCKGKDCFYLITRT
ncbi:class I SAM-dependent methyltransferase [Desulfurococcaceae archaeon MEX13E-LK6-19]|nr:class I SAM-dependent methyltransferase [Desulfurococcaceae archaeon MEX13E-LK6-19]